MAKADHNTDSSPTGAVVSSADTIAAGARKAAKGRGPAPVHLWNPPFCGDLDIRIARDGTWFYLGTPIGRMPLVKLFASVLKKEGGKHFLVTPVEKVGIMVDDAPFVAVDFTARGEGRAQSVTFRTNLDEEAEAGPDHSMRVTRDPDTGEPSPYVMIRSGMEALIDRKSFYRLVDLCCEEEIEGTAQFGLWSGGVFWPFVPAHELK